MRSSTSSVPPNWGRAAVGTCATRPASGTSRVPAARSTTTTRRARWRRRACSFTDEHGAPIDVELTPISPSVSFDMAHTCEVPEHWLYWRILVEARVSGWSEPVRGWVEASRYGC